ncbi:hypothetical protein FE257_000942 [Aspergillus nanangensis]|uniref:mannan endo-1,4-beta-mannosidase n=1 Tax=Aspergillus nanangensis TaxID=2582783 RepID=A0AAD4GPY1_ASPNN|nr:hypothetical protein FE257_000942 [Aspergillus nanangensis]
MVFVRKRSRAAMTVENECQVDAWPHPAPARNWAGVNSYFLHAFQEHNRTQVLDAVQAANLKAIRIFISYTPENNKDTGSVYMPDIEPDVVGRYDDTQLKAIDQLMVEAHERDIKLIITLHDRYQLGCWGNDTYVTKYDLPALDCATGSASANDVTSWYKNPRAIRDFDNRIQHCLEHRNRFIRGSPKWKDLAEYIFAFDIQNEGQGHLNQNIAPVPKWWCDRSRFMRSIMGRRSKVLIGTGGGNEFSNSDIPENWACDAIDLVGIHSYSAFDVFQSKVPLALKHALKANKLTVLEEFGSMGAGKADTIEQHVNFFNELGVPWLPWQISKPGYGEGNYEFWVDEPTYTVVKKGARKALQSPAKQKFWDMP